MGIVFAAVYVGFALGLNPSYSSNLECLQHILSKQLQQALNSKRVLVQVPYFIYFDQQLETVLQTLSRTNVATFIVRTGVPVYTINTSQMESKINIYIAFGTRVVEILETIRTWKSQSQWNPLAQVMVIVSGEVSELMSSEMLMVFKSEGMHRVCLIIERSIGVQVVTLHPYTFFKNKDRAHVPANIIAECSGFTNRTLLSTVDTNHRQTKFCGIVVRTLQVSVMRWEPFTYLENKDGDFAGIEVDLIKTAAQHLNMHLIFREEPFVRGNQTQIIEHLRDG